jgi:WD40 repeat protein
VATEDAAGTIQVFAVDTAEQVAIFREPRAGASRADERFVDWLPGGRELVFVTGRGVRRLDVPLPESAPLKYSPPEQLGRTDLEWTPVGAVFTSDGKRMLTGPGSSTLRLIEVESGKEVRQFTGVTVSHVIRKLALSADDRFALIGGGQTLNTQRLTLWDVEGWKPVRIFEGLESLPECVAFSPNGQQALCGTLEGLVHVLDVATGKLQVTYRPGVRSCRALAVSPDGKLAAYIGSDRDMAIRLFSVVTGEELRQLAGQAGTPSGVWFMPDGKELVSAGADNTIRLWDVASGKIARTIDVRGRIQCAAISSDGKCIVAGLNDGTVAAYIAATGQQLARYAHHTGEITAVTATAEPKRILSASADRTVRVWALPPADSTGTKPMPDAIASRSGESVEIRTLVEQRSALLQRTPDGEIYSLGFQRPFNDSVWDELANLPKLNSLSLPPLMPEAQYANLKRLKGLQTLHVQGRLSESAIREIGKLTGLVFLSLSFSGITDQGLAYLKPLEKLHSLSMVDSRITDEGLVHLDSGFNLHYLNLSRSLVSGEGLKHLVSLVELQQLSLSGSPLTNDGLAALANLKGLTDLRLNQCNGVSDEGLKNLAGLAKLKILELNETAVSDAGLAHLSGLKSLQSLGLGKTRVTDAGLAHLYGLEALTSLDVRQAIVSEAAVVRLKQHVPRLARVMGFEAWDLKK